MDNINKLNTELNIDNYFTTENHTINWRYKVKSTDNTKNYLNIPLTITELFPETSVDHIKYDVFFGVATNVKPVTTDNEIVNNMIKEENLLPSEFLKRNQSFGEEDLYIDILHTKLFRELNKN